jgi:hypothetical protein
MVRGWLELRERFLPGNWCVERVPLEDCWTK